MGNVVFVPKLKRFTTKAQRSKYFLKRVLKERYEACVKLSSVAAVGNTLTLNDELNSFT